MTVITRALAVLLSLSVLVAPSVAASISHEDRDAHAHRARSARLPAEPRGHDLTPRNIPPHPSTIKGASWSPPASYLSGVEGRGLSVIYNWAATPPSGFSSKYGVEYACQLRDGKASSIAAFEKNCPSHNYWMAMNEINLPPPSGSGLSASAAASLYRQYMLPGCRTNKYCVSPSVTTAPGALSILQNFFNDLGGISASHIQAVSVHPYDSDVQKVIAYVESVHKEFGLPIWITETTCHAFYGSHQSCTIGETEQFFKALIAWARTTSYVKMVIPFGWMSGSEAAAWGVGSDIALLTSGNKLTSIANSFLSA